MDVDSIIEKHALHNAVKFEGKANIGAVLGAVISEYPDAKKNIKEISKKINEIVKKINSMLLLEQTKLLNEKYPEMQKEEKHEQKRDLPELKNAEQGKVATRMPPEPSKYMHIGHALSFLINYFYAKKYNGKCVLRFEDSNPEKSTKEFYESIKEDIRWLKIEPDKEVVASNDMDKFYACAEELIKKGKAYICFCNSEKMQDLRFKKLVCECRDSTIEKNLYEWKNMISKKYNEKFSVLRLKGDMESNNGVMRDPVIFRISYTKHFLQRHKYCVWPMYDFENSIEEELCGVTHILRSNEFDLRVELQEYIKDLLKFRKQEVYQYGRFNISNAVTQGRVIREMIEKKEVIGWDDPRLVTIKALKRRGILPETIHQLAFEVGLSKTQTNVDFTIIAAINRRILDPVCNRHFFIENPKKIKIEKAPEQTVELKLHPDFPDKGKRTFKTHQWFYITQEDFNSIEEGKLYRLMDCLNFRKKADKFVFDSVEYEKYKDVGEKIMHWLPFTTENIKVEVMMDDATVRKGVAESSVSKLNINEIVQFERFGFVKLDSIKKGKMVFWFSHK